MLSNYNNLIMKVVYNMMHLPLSNVIYLDRILKYTGRLRQYSSMLSCTHYYMIKN